MAEITARADASFNHDDWADLVNEVRSVETAWDAGSSTTDAITMAAVRVAEQVGAVAIVCLSRTGYTVRSVSRFRPRVPIMAFSPDPRAVRQLSLSWGSAATHQPDSATARETIDAALHAAKTDYGLQTADKVVVISGHSMRARATDTLRVMDIA